MKKGPEQKSSDRAPHFWVGCIPSLQLHREASRLKALGAWTHIMRSTLKMGRDIIQQARLQERRCAYVSIQHVCMYDSKTTNTDGQL